MLSILMTLILSTGVWDCAVPRPKVRSWEIVKNEVRMADGSAFNHLDYPWTEAICDAWDDPAVREIWLSFAARLGKTVIAQSLMVAAQRANPSPALFGSSTEELAKRIVKTKLWPMLVHSPATAGVCPPKHKRAETLLCLRHSTIHVAWAGSPTMLADLAARYLHANEISKWTKKHSEEADPLKLFLERGMEIPDRKVIGESTPTVEGACRISARVALGTNRRLHVPCPKCGVYQELVLQTGSPGGLIWDHLAGGESEPNLASRTARYQCAHCAKEFHDEDRRPIIRRGVWVPHGCRATAKGKIEGHFGGPKESFQLSRLYAPTFTFGQVAEEYVAAVHALKAGDVEPLRNFMNSWMGLPWVEKRTRKKWEDVAAALSIGEWELGTCPRWAVILTAGFDVQLDHFVYWISAWGPGGRGGLVDYGECNSFADVKAILERPVPHADGGRPLPIWYTLMDSRHRQAEVDEFCRSVNREGRRVWPSQGVSAKQMTGKPYKFADPDDPRNRERAQKMKAVAGQLQIVSINAEYWQEVADRYLYTITANQPKSFTFPTGCREDEDLWSQLLNEVRRTGAGETGWVQVKEHTPVDLRDAFRYSRVAADVALRRKWDRLDTLAGSRKRSADKPSTKTRPKPPPASHLELLDRPGGWLGQGSM